MRHAPESVCGMYRNHCAASTGFCNRNFSTLNSNDINLQVKEYANWTKHHFGLSIFIQLENFSRKILKALDPSACDNSKSTFQSIYTTLNSRINIAFPEAIPLYELIRLVRNTIHNDSVFRNKKSTIETVIYKGNKYSFIPEKPIDFVTWGFLIDITNDVILLITDIIKNKKISNLIFLIS